MEMQIYAISLTSTRMSKINKKILAMSNAGENREFLELSFIAGKK